MTTAAPSGSNSYALLRAAEAVTNWRALAMSALAGLAFFLFLALSGWLAKSSVLLGGLFFLLSLVLGLVGYSSVGIVLMRRSQGQDIGLVDAFLQALFTVHRLLGLAVLLFLAFVGLALATLLVLAVCKIPGLGPLVYSVAFPILTVILGLTTAGMFYVVMPLAAPAIWSGNTIWETAARMLVIVRQRLLPVITQLVILSLLVLFLSGVVTFVLMTGYMTTLGLSSAVGINASGNAMGMVQSMMLGGMGGMGGMGGLGGLGGYGMDGATSYFGAFAFATGLLFTVGMIIPFLTFINGTCLIYLQTIEGLHFDAAEEQLRGHVDEAKRRAQEARERASAKLQEVKAAQRAPQEAAPTAPAASVAPAAAATPAATARACASCHAPLAADDVFCGECGAKNPL
ncbi:hypothetical protein [Rugamonas rubra]|uniref:Zinc-ribbon domain-containing protein n=1 Tax=Rugamonas rubra TaxID=758825 RepID=A0A1I4I1X5_9BURK|nr:hypothetical protein [Rugamonas rubra]SFL48438.1 hypothetical protein SAMN02982985_00408 [Rugamonas rubra]